MQGTRQVGVIVIDQHVVDDIALPIGVRPSFRTTSGKQGCGNKYNSICISIYILYCIACAINTSNLNRNICVYFVSDVPCYTGLYWLI